MKNVLSDVEERERWRRHWLSSIAEIADISLQRRMWLSTEKSSPHWSFVEFVCKYMNDLGIDDGYATALRLGHVSSEEFDTVTVFHAAIGRYDAPGADDYDDAAILDDPNWQEVVRLAGTACLVLSTIVHSTEKDLLFLGSTE